MKEQQNTENIDAKEKPAETPATETPAEETVKEEPSAEELLKKEVEKLKAELKEKDDKYLRMAAEYDNFRRRSREEKDAVYDNAVSDTVSGLLPIFDNLERATGFDDGEKVKEGLLMTLKTVKDSLEKIGVKEFGAPGDTFDPKLHNAVMHTEEEDKGEGEILEVYQKGYQKGNKIIRFAMVKSAN